MKIARKVFGLALMLPAFACGGGTDVSEFQYGGNQPGASLAEGGEIRHENVRILGMPVQTWIHVYQYSGPEAAANAPFPAPAEGGLGVFGNCVDERAGSPTWPFHPITGATYLTLPQVKLSGPGITGSLDIVETTPPNMVGNSTFRHHDFTYGGGAPGSPPSGFNGTLTAAQSTPGGDYTLNIGQNDMTYHMPEAYVAPLGIGGADTVMIAAGQDLEFTWTEPPNDFGDDGFTHNRKTHFNFTFFADPNAANAPQFICFPDSQGHQVVPKAVIDLLPAGGLIVNADLSHFLDKQDAGGTDRRFDLVSIFCNISLYSKQ